MTWPQDLNKVIAEKVAEEKMRQESAERWRIQRDLFNGKGCTKPQPRWDPSAPVLPRQTSMGPRHESDVQHAIEAARVLDHQYAVAAIAGNQAAMQRAVATLVKLLERAMIGRKQGDYDKMQQVRAEILRNASNIAPIVQNLTRAQLEDMRRSPPGPGGQVPNIRFDPPNRTPRRR